MNHTRFVSAGMVYDHLECIHGLTFTLAIYAGKSALLPVNCAGFAAAGVESAYVELNKSRIGCRSPVVIVA